jgi:drug/metabolite transporter (DMT)-like permease
MTVQTKLNEKFITNDATSRTDMTSASFNHAMLKFAPLIVPVSAVCGAICGALSGRYASPFADPVLVAITIAIASIGGVPIGFLFWAMKDTSESIRAVIMAFFVLACVVAFVAFFIPLKSIASL